MNKGILALTLFLSAAAFAHGGGHLKGTVVTVGTNQLTLTTESKTPESVGFDKETRFENSGKGASAAAMAPGLRVVVHLREGAKPAVAAVVKFAAPASVRIEVSVNDDGFVLGTFPPLKAGTPVTLVVTRTVEQTCAKDIVLKDFGLSVPLPLAKPVEVTFVPKQAGRVHFACAMDMLSGDLQVQ